MADLSKSANLQRTLDCLCPKQYGIHLVQLKCCVCKLEIHRARGFFQGHTKDQSPKPINYFPFTR